MGSQMDLAEGMEMGESLSSSSPCQIQRLLSAIGSPALRFLPPRDVDEGSPLHSPQYELIEVVTHAVAKLISTGPLRIRLNRRKAVR